jgi:NADPH dehydrogenase (quinone)
MNMFILNGADPRGFSKGLYNQALCEVAVDFFSTRGHAVKSTRIQDGYDIDEEVEKFHWADTILYQFPIYWFHMPAPMKAYIDNVFMAGRGKIWLNDGRDQGGPYGSGGLLNARYMLSTTWNAPDEAFKDADQIFDGKDIDGALFAFHKMQEFMGASALPSFSCHNIVKQGDLEGDKERFRRHLLTTFKAKA